MNKPFLVCLMVLFAFAQTMADGFLSVHSADGNVVWAVGNNGSVFRSLDGGNTWSAMVQGTSTLRSVFAFGNAVWMVGDEGRCYASTDGGASFDQKNLVGNTNLTCVRFLDSLTGWIAGANGTLLKTTDGGTVWSPVTVGTSETITSLFFVDALTGYLGGTNGLVMKTINGGASWLSIGGTGWSKTITSIEANGSTVYVTGRDAFCMKSTDAGSTWLALNFMTDAQSDVNDVFVKSANEAWFVGGGGYIRRTTSGGASFEWPKHGLHAPLNDIFFFNAQKGWACGEKTNVVLRTTDGGTTWLMPQGTTVAAAWSQKLSVSATVRGNAFSISAFNKNTIYCALGTRVYVSYNRGETWTQIATMPTGGTKVNSFYVSPKDTNLWVAAYGAPDRIVRSTDRGVSWTVTMTRDFSEYGMPLEMDGSHPDTLYFGPEDGRFYRSTDFGATWNEVSAPGFRSPCDIVVVRDKPEVIWVGDGVTGSGQGQMFRSGDGGQTFQLIYSTSGSEIPTIAGSSLDNALGFATAWGSGGVTKTVDFGLSWSSVASTSSTWGVDIAKDDPNVVMYGVYGGATSYLSSNAGTSFSTSPLTGSNYAILAYDRGTFLAQQSGGIYKYNFTYTVPTSSQQALTLISPNGGENWSYGTTRTITWASTNILNVKIEYKTSPTASWQTIVASTPGPTGSYSWQIPNTPTTQARVRISDAGDGSPVDSSDNPFTISVAAFSAQPNPVNFGNVPVGTRASRTVTISNSGTAALVVTSVLASDPTFSVSRSSFTVPAGQSDTIQLHFTPTIVGNISGEMQFSCNVPGSPAIISVSGNGTTAASISVIAPNGGETWRAGTTENITWTATALTTVALSYKTSPTASWQNIAQGVPASSGTYAWLIPNSPTTQARVRIMDEITGTIVDSSDGFFTILGPNAVAEGGIPTSFELSQNYPNPFNPSTIIAYGLPKDAAVSLKVYNMIGQEIATLVNERQSAGRYVVTFNTQSLPFSLSSGMYFYRLQAGDVVEIRKMMLVK
jgi:photosystem II stability/assembly factor-like uncharacterized protein